MGIGLAGAIGGFAQGVGQGLKLRSDLEDAEQRRKYMEEQSKREEKRLGFEEARANREEQTFGYTLKDLKRKDIRAESEDAALAELQSTYLGGQPAQPQQPAAPAGAIAAPTTVEAPAAPVASAAPAAPAQGIAPPTGAAPATPAAAPKAPVAPTNNPFVNTVKGPELDNVYDRQAKALQKYYIAKGDVDKAMQVPKMMKELRDFEWTDKVGASLAGMAGNAPGARDAFAKVYGVVNDGYDLDPKSGKFDPNKGWTGLVRVNKETGARETFDLSPTQAAVIASRFKDPATVIQYVQGQQDKERNFKLEERKTRASEVTAGAAATNAQANAAESAQKGKYYEAYGEYLGRKGREEADAAKQNASVQAAMRMFPLAGKEFKPEELMLDDDKGKGRLAKKEADERMFNKTMDLAGLNPSIDIRTLAQIARKGQVDAQQDQDGRVFTTINGKKIFLQ